VREAFEQAILDDPDDPASYAAYADWLAEQGDPRGEFVRMQLALQDESRPAPERAELRAREAELLARYETQWLGKLGPHLRGSGGRWEEARPATEHAWSRGFLWSIRAQCLTTSLAQALADEPAARFLRELRVFGEARHFSQFSELAQPMPRVIPPEGAGEHWELLELIGAACLRNLTVFQMGEATGQPPDDGWCDCYTYANGLEHVVAGMPRVEELHLLCKGYDLERLVALPNLTNLRVLRLYHLGARGNEGERERYRYPLDLLAANPALANLTHLLIHPHGNEYHSAHPFDVAPRMSFLPLEQVRHLLGSPHLTRLTHLQLRLSDMGDGGVREIINSGILSRLKVLDLRHGAITDEGARLFAACAEARDLERLDLSRNGVTSAGLEALTKAGVAARAEEPLSPHNLARREYLLEGDGE
jgi:uncharacterized protein (TIGR02996 family)